MKKITDLPSEIIDNVVSELFSNKFTDDQRNDLLNTAIVLVNRSATSQLLQSSLTILRYFPEALDTWCNVGKEIALTSIVAAEEYFRSSPDVLQEIRKEELGSWASLGIRIAEKSDEAAVEYFKASAKLLKTLALSDLIRWGNEGLRILQDGAKSEKAAIEYFALGTRRSFEHAIAGEMALLEENIRILKLYGEAISGREVNIQPVVDYFGTDGRAIYMPVSLNIYGEKETNFRLYRALTARLVGRMIYGSFDLDLSKVGFDIKEVAARYGSKLKSGIRSTEAFFQLYPNPLLAMRIFEILEDARVERMLRKEYRGIGEDMDLFLNAFVRKKGLDEMTQIQAILQVLLETLLFGKMPDEIPSQVKNYVQECLPICQAAGDRVEDTALATDRIYRILEQIPGSRHDLPHLPKEMQEFAGLMMGKIGIAWRPSILSVERMGNMHEGRRRAVTTLLRKLVGTARKIQTTNLLNPRGLKPIEPKEREEAVFRYDEWDCDIGDYRRRWCSVRETTIRPGSARFAENVLKVHSALIAAVRREFQMFKPERLKKERKQTDGDDFDIDAAIESFLEVRAGTPEIGGRVYTRCNKIQRDISAAFLVDMSGSTAGWIMDTQKKALIVMCEALEAIGDRYAIYGFSGATREGVEFHIVKDFEEKYGQTVKGRIGSMESISQNRDGAAIRHAAHKLERSESKTKLLVVISDGRPLDMVPGPGEPLYQGQYSVQDTRMALKEVKAKGIRPFCITVDRKASDYISTMYAEVNYVIIDDVSKLPEKMPAIYRRLTT